MKALYVSVALLALAGCTEKSSTEYLGAAKTYMSESNNGDAVIQLKKAIKQDPNMAEARFLLGKVYFELNQFDNAEKELEKALDKGHSAESVYPYLLKAYINNRSYHVLSDLDAEELNVPSIATELNFYKLNAFINLNRERDFDKLYSTLPDDNDDSFVLLSKVLNTFNKAGSEKRQMTTHELAVASVAIEKVLMNDEKSQFALKYKTVTRILAQKPEESAEVYKKYLEHYPADMEMKFKYIELMISLNKAGEIESIVDKLLTVNEKHAVLNRFKGIARFSDNDHAAALEFAEKGLMNNTTDVSLRLLAGQSAYVLEKYEAAATHILLVQNKLDNSHNAIRVLALSLLQSNQVVKASDVLLSMEGLTEKDSLLYSNATMALVEMGEKIRAEKLMKKSSGLGESSESLASRGIAQISMNDISGISSLKKAIDKAPESSDAKIALASAYLRMNDLKALNNHVASWLKSDADNVSALYFKSRLELRSGDDESARRTLNKILTVDNDNKEARMALVDMAYKRGDKEDAEKLLESLLSKDSSYVPAIAQSYLQSKENGDSESVIALIEDKLKSDPKNVDLSLLLGGILISEGQNAKAVTLLEGIKSEGKLPSRYWMLIVEAYAKTKNMAKVIESNEKWLEAYPGNNEAIISSLMTLSSRNMYKDALEISQDYLKKQGRNDYIQLLNTHFLVMTGDFRTANDSYNKLSKEMTSIPFAKGILAKIQISKKDFKGALGNLKEAYKAERNHENIKLIYKLNAALGNVDEGYRMLVSHVNELPKDVLSLMMLADIQLRKSPDESIESYKKALEINGNNYIALNNVANLYMNKGDLENAQTCAEKAVSIKGDIPNILDTLAMIYVAKNDNKSALAELRKAVALDNVSYGVYLNFIEQLVANDQKGEAEREVYKYKSLYGKNEKARTALEERRKKINI